MFPVGDTELQWIPSEELAIPAVVPSPPTASHIYPFQATPFTFPNIPPVPTIEFQLIPLNE